ncbi:MAG: hypothetical protein LUC17_00685 [Oscillospiraceae bacterium]|nr:hypothetical protein [Oscillospiraceae bacterium]
MPRTSPDKTEQQNRVYRSVIEGNKALYNLTDEFLAKKLGISVRTYHNRMVNPEMFSNGDNRILVEVLHITKEQWDKIGGF